MIIVRQVVQDCHFNCPVDAPGSMCDDCRQKLSGDQVLPTSKRRMPIVELPLSATEDRVVGTLHVGHALKTGQRKVREHERRFDVAVDATLRAAMIRQGPELRKGSFTVSSEDLRKKKFNRPYFKECFPIAMLRPYV